MGFWDLFRRQSATATTWIDAAELQRRMDAGGKLLILDVRQPEEFAAPPGRLPGARNIPLPELARRTARIWRRRASRSWWCARPTGVPPARRQT